MVVLDGGICIAPSLSDHSKCFTLNHIHTHSNTDEQDGANCSLNSFMHIHTPMAHPSRAIWGSLDPPCQVPSSGLQSDDGSLSL